jgi:hypothetical protein
MPLIDHVFASLSDNQALANAVIGIAGIVLAAAALLVAMIALIVGLTALRSQRRHDLRSARPLPAVTVTSFEDCLKVELENNGTGPLIVKSIRVTKGRETRQSIHAWMPVLPGAFNWTRAVGVVDNLSLAPGGRLGLIELNWDEADGEIGFDDFAIIRDACNGILKSLTVAVSHTDVYGTRLEPYERELG